MIAEDSEEEQNAVELNTYIRNQRKSLAKYDQASHSSDVSDGEEKPPNRDDDEQLMRNMQFIFNQDKLKQSERKPTMVDIELDADAPQEDEIEFDRVGSLESEKSSQLSNPYV